MKKMFAMMLVVILSITVAAFAADDKKPELRPAQILMQKRAAAMTDMNKNLEVKNFAAIVKAADALAAESKTNGEKMANPLAKEITLALSVLAKEASAAAAKGDTKGIKTKLGEIKGKCGECHVKIRDKK